MQITQEIFAMRLFVNGNNCGAHTFPYIESKTNCKIEHEATTSKIGEDQVFIAINAEFN
jgi:Fe-S cluster assembly scaffold protein SufB